ncbi:MAG: CDP-diacylglycerol--glycerol-3-phosphate 3-phosphatidyltransferase [Verrucomicrobia bacterium]|nr:CDP-diacylglycerol--glycerol-3-phosphate 3-phosphatidyltransferase [bacterium]NDD56154.1 CDP-diacylglycerol--glycerol-3-phosphate 3-phosphatidyltransferase [Verrucomicrobiota bacterium]
MTIPDWLTLGRVAATFVLLILLQACAHPPVPLWTAWLALTLFVAAALTDWLDGHLARKWKIESDFGRLFDPLADKLLVAVAFVGLLGAGLLPVWFVSLVVAREFLITGIRLVAGQKGVVLAAESVGKHKTVTQMITATLGLLLLALDPAHPIGRRALEAAVWITAIVTAGSGLWYLKANYPLLVKQTLRRK